MPLVGGHCSCGSCDATLFQYPLCRIDSCHYDVVLLDKCITVAFQYPLCRIDSCHSRRRRQWSMGCKPFSIRSVGSIHATIRRPPASKQASACRFQYPLCRIDSCHPVALFGRLLGHEASPSFSIRSVGSLLCHSATVDTLFACSVRWSFQYPLCRIDSCHPKSFIVESSMRLVSFSIRSVGSIHVSRVDQLAASRMVVSVSALSDRFMPLLRFIDGYWL